MATVTIKIGVDQAETNVSNAKMEKVVDRFVRRELKARGVGVLPESYATMTLTEKLNMALAECLEMLSDGAQAEHREQRRREQEETLTTELTELKL